MALVPLTKPQAQRWRRMETEATKYSHLWTIHNLVYQCNEKRELRHSAFSSSTNDNFKWLLELYPEGFDEYSLTHLSLRLVLISCNNNDIKEVKAAFKLFIINKWSQRTNLIQGQSYFSISSSLEFGDFVERKVLFDESSGLLKGKTLSLYCEVRVLEKSVILSDSNFKVPECTLLDEFEQLLDTKNFSDIIISVKGKEFYGHKAILAARSPVFSAMFEHEMKEKEQNLVEITDMSHEVVGEMLRFIYTGRTPKLETLAVELLAAADKYALGRLKVMCEKYLASKLSANSAAGFLVLADKHSADQLKSHAIEFVRSHASEVLETSGFKTMSQMHVHLIIEIFRAQATCP